MDGALHVQLCEADADAERLDTLAGFLRGELLQLDVEDVTAMRVGDASPGARAFDVAAVGELLVGLGHSAEGLLAVVLAIKTWLARGAGVHRTVRMEIDGDVLELSGATEADQDRLVGLFVSRHSARHGEQ